MSMRITKYTTTFSIPVAVSFKCPYCGNENIRAFYIRGQNTSTSKPSQYYMDSSSQAAYNKLVEKVNTLRDAPDIETLKSAGLNCVCKKCGKTPPWANMGGISKLGAIRLVMVCLILLAVFIMGLTSRSDGGGFDFTTLFSEHLGMTITMLALILIGIIALFFVRGKKEEPLATEEETMPKIIAIGPEAMEYNPPEPSRFV